MLAVADRKSGPILGLLLSSEKWKRLALFEDLAADHFGLEPTSPAREINAGNINRTAVISAAAGDFVLQDINASIFGDTDALMRNVEKVVQRQRECNLPTIEFVRTRSDGLITEHKGSVWRCYRFVEGEATPPIETRDDAQSTARAFGRYARAIDGLELDEHLAGYHDFDARVDAFFAAVSADAVGRLESCGRYVDDLVAMIDRLRVTSAFEARREVPVRNAHNDAKGPNCIIGSDGRTIIDLDTTMPGTVLSDVGELVRSSTRSMDDASPEALMEQVVSVNRGFLAGYGLDLTGAEHACMLLSGPLLTVENSMRFMADHLSGDAYYGAATVDQNLDRSITQLRLAERLVESIELATSGALGAA